jgi:tetratricopeptide (TPR) repeat protein
MGRKRTRKRKHFFLYLACLITVFFVISGCLHFPIPKEWQGEQHLEKARSLIARGEYEAALQESKTVLSKFPKSLAAQALFQMGLIYVHPENPNLNYQKSLESFQRIVTAFHGSDLRDDAQIWVLLIRQIVDEEKEIGNLKEKNASLEKTVRADKKNIKYLQKKIKYLQDQIEELKRVDMGIEEKKREIMPQSEDLEEKENDKNPGS